jgi:hypothetical protein
MYGVKEKFKKKHTPVPIRECFEEQDFLLLLDADIHQNQAIDGNLQV